MTKATLGSQFIPGKKKPTNESKSDSLPLQPSPISVHQVTTSAGQTAFPAEEMVTDKEVAGVCVIGCINNCGPLLDRGLLKARMEQEEKHGL